MNNFVIIVGIIGAIVFIINSANASLDFAGSIGFDMFERNSWDEDGNHHHNDYYRNDEHYNGHNDEHYNGASQIAVRIVSGEDNGMPDFYVYSDVDQEYVTGEEFEDDKKAKVKLDAIWGTKVCIQTTYDQPYKDCQRVDNSQVTFYYSD